MSVSWQRYYSAMAGSCSDRRRSEPSSAATSQVQAVAFQIGRIRIEAQAGTGWDVEIRLPAREPAVAVHVHVRLGLYDGKVCDLFHRGQEVQGRERGRSDERRMGRDRDAKWF